MSDLVQEVFYAALTKAAEEGALPTFSSVAKLRQTLRRGDILISTPKPLAPGAGLVTRAADEVRKQVLRVAQGGEHVHSMIYAGNDKVLDLRFDGVSKLPLREAVEGMGIIAVRPQVTAKAKSKALKRIAEAADRVRFSTTGLLRPALSQFVPITKEKTRDLTESVCSTIIAKAFDSKIVPGKARDAVAPVDFIHSSRTTTLGELKP